MGITIRKMSTLYSGLMKIYRKIIDDQGQCKTISQFWEYPHEAHHLISCSVMHDYEKGKLDKLVLKTDYDINAATNGIGLPAKCGHQMVNEEVRHKGKHDKTCYFKRVENCLASVYKKYMNYKPSDICNSKTLQKNLESDLHSRENYIRKMIVNRKWWLYQWSQSLYENDYRDEGDTNLNSDRSPECNYATGIEWVKNFGPGKIKRRFKKVGGMEVIRSEWYEKFDYPVPKSLKK